MNIPLVDLRVQYQAIRPEVQGAIERVLDQMQLFLGPECTAFEEEFAAYCACRYGVAVSNGTDALVLALRACGIGTGDEVVTVPNTFIATVEAIALVGAIPVFVDIDPVTYTLDWRQLETVLTSRTRAVLPVHLYGHPADMQEILDFARKHGLRIIEDASQAHGAMYNGQRVGSFGDVGCFSLYCSKNLGAYGEAGICVTNNVTLAEKMQSLRNHGSRRRYHHEVLGTNARLDELQAAILRVKLRYLEQWNAARQKLAAFYTKSLRGVVEAVPTAQSNVDHVYYTYIVQVQQREQFRKCLESKGIATGIHYPVPLHLQPACAQYGYSRGSFPVTEYAADRVVSLPMYPELTGEQAQEVVHAVQESCRAGVRI